VLALGQDVDLSLLDGVPTCDQRRHRSGWPEHDGPRRRLRRRRYGAVGTDGDRRRRAWQEAAPTDAWLRGTIYAAPQHEVAEFGKLNTCITPMRPRPCGPSSNWPGVRRLRRSRGLDETNAVRGATLPVVRQLFECDNCWRVSDNAVIKWDPASASVQFRLLQGLRICVSECPCGAIKMVPETI
jgi:Pyruvate/2-oxoacid:ferredoxin oxidoreductase delta subunit